MKSNGKLMLQVYNRFRTENNQSSIRRLRYKGVVGCKFDRIEAVDGGQKLSVSSTYLL